MLVESFSGIRWIYGKDLTPLVIKKYASVYSQFVKKIWNKDEEKTNKKPIIIIGHDSRPSSEEIKKIIINVIGPGFLVIDVGLSPTPTIEHAVRIYSADGGIIITASHNEPEFNGLKLLQKYGAVLNSKQMNEIITLVHNMNYVGEPVSEPIVINRHDNLNKKYIEFILDTIGQDAVRKIQLSTPKLVIDPNGGSASKLVKEFVRKLDLNALIVNDEPGKFKRLVEPNQQSLRYLIPLIQKNKMDFAAGFDCDADRVELILGDGSLLSGQQMLALIIDYVLSVLPPKQKVVVNTATSNVVKEICDKYNAEFIEVDVGEINVVTKMEEVGAVIGGEGSSSGAIIPPSKCRDGLLSLAFVLRITAEKNQKLDVLIKELPKYFTLRKKVQCKDVEIIRKRLYEHFILKYGEERVKLFGDSTGALKVYPSENTWMFFRASKTEPNAFRIMTDAPTKEIAEKLIDNAIKIFEGFNK